MESDGRSSVGSTAIGKGAFMLRHSSTDNEGRLIADHPEEDEDMDVGVDGDVGEVGDMGTSGAGDLERTEENTRESCSDFFVAMECIDGRGRMPSSMTLGSSFSLPSAFPVQASGMPRFRVVRPTFFIDFNAWLARERNVLDRFIAYVLDFASSGVFEMWSFRRTFTTSTTSPSNNLRLLLDSTSTPVSRPSLRLGMTTVSWLSLDDLLNTGARLSVCWAMPNAASSASMSGGIDKLFLLSIAASK